MIAAEHIEQSVRLVGGTIAPWIQDSVLSWFDAMDAIYEKNVKSTARGSEKSAGASASGAVGSAAQSIAIAAAGVAVGAIAVRAIKPRD